MDCGRQVKFRPIDEHAIGLFLINSWSQKMGYSVDYKIKNAIIPEDEWAGALVAINGLFYEGRRYSWLPDGTRNHTDLGVAIAEWGFDFQIQHSPEQNQKFLKITDFQWEKSGDEEFLLRALAPHISPGAVFECREDGGDTWRYIFRDGEMIAQQGRIVYE